MQDTLIEEAKATDNSDNVKVISMLYDGALNFIRIAKDKSETGDSTGKSFYVNKAKAIILELSNSLRMDTGEISQNLKQLYEFTLDSLNQGNEKDDVNAFENAEKVIEILRDGWKEMEKVKQTDFEQVS